MDHSVLEQFSAINCSSFSTDNLPSDLENCFRKLKSLPTAATGSCFPLAKTKSFTPRFGNDLNINERHSNSVGDFERNLDLKKSPPSIEYSSGNRNTSVDDFERNLEMNISPAKSPTEYSDRFQDASNGTYSKSKPKSKSLKSNSNLSNYRSDSWNLSSPESKSVSPVRRSIGCLWCSPKKEKRKQEKENRSLSSSSWGNDYGSDYDVEFQKLFPMKEQKKIMKKAMKEEEKIAKEAEKIVKWVKQASSRMMDVSGIVDYELLSDLEDDTN